WALEPASAAGAAPAHTAPGSAEPEPAAHQHNIHGYRLPTASPCEQARINIGFSSTLTDRTHRRNKAGCLTTSSFLPHSFCTPCLQECLKPKKPVCGVCRSTLAPGSRALDLEKQIETTETTCNGCHKKMYLSKMRSHAASCSKYQNYIMEGVKAVTKESFPNRFTFPCPYCSEKNFDQEGLVEHCKALHSMDAKQVVCPICASMPWGDPNYRSANFMEHLQRRHRFSYDTFVVGFCSPLELQCSLVMPIARNPDSCFCSKCTSMQF
uniref:RING-type E3 ubiquitin transferase n=1 Tax=Cyanistes caeruleus TaxID=156563 RepID=A0A8C0UIN6_CYACU